MALPRSAAASAREHEMEPIAIVGMACRLPGEVEDPSAFWELMMQKRCPSSARVPESRFNIDAFQHPNNERPGSFNVPGGYFLDGDPRDFDPTFFGITPVEATYMDPQQRKLLEVTMEAFENSGTPLEQVSGSRTGTYVASFTADCQQMSFKEFDFRHSYSATGVDPGILANRIGNAFNLRGPSALINTACSSSLYALHMACTALRNRECDGAIVAGSNLVLTLDQHMNTAKLGVLSPTSQCHTFDESADGYARAESVGALYLKPLSAALRNGDPVRAVVRSSATNSNGKIQGMGITHPSIEGQSAVMRAAHERASLDPSHTFYIECHGTGTPTGDPKEVRAISNAIVGDGKRSQPILVGSVKPNTGHAEASSSIATVMKAVLSIENGLIPPTAGITNLSTAIPWNDLQVKPVMEPTAFPGELRRIGVNAFGYGGTNASAILDNHGSSDMPVRSYKSARLAFRKASRKGRRQQLLVFSAHDKATLKRNINAFSALPNLPDIDDLAYTLNSRRSKMAARSFSVCRQDSANHDVLEALHTIKEAGSAANIAFAFTGQGAQWPRMGSALFEAFPSFAQTIADLDSALTMLEHPPKWTIKELLMAPESSSRVHDAEISQPLCTAVQIGLVRLLGKWNVVPQAAIGHSSGEMAAAFCAGLVSAEDAIIAAYYRGKVVSYVPPNGSMLAVGLGATDVAPVLEHFEGRAKIACHNSPQSVTLSGDADAIKELQEHFVRQNVFAREVKTGGRAYHSEHMKQPAAQYREMLRAQTATGSCDPWRRMQCKMISTVTNSVVEDGQVNRLYWAQNLESPVLFNQGLETLLGSVPSVNLIVEIGPHSALSGPIRQILSGTRPDTSYAPTLKRGEDDADQLLRLAGELWARDARIDLDAVTRVEQTSHDGAITERQGVLVVDLPHYQWNYAKKYYSEPRQSLEHKNCKHPRHDILGRRIPGLSHAEPQWRNVLRLGDLPWLKHHTLGNEVVFPAAGYISMAVEALTQVNSDSSNPLLISNFSLKTLRIKSALVVPDDSTGVEVILALHSETSRGGLLADDLSKQWFRFTITSLSSVDNQWYEHASGLIGLGAGDSTRQPDPSPPLALCNTGKSWYRKLSEVGFDYGQIFRSISKVRTDQKQQRVVCDATINRESGMVTGESRYVIHPGPMDCCLQSIICAIWSGQQDSVRHGFVPTSIESITIWQRDDAYYNNAPSKVNTKVTAGGTRYFMADSQLSTADGALLMDFTGVNCIAYEAAVPQSFASSQEQSPYWETQWKPDITLMQDTESLKTKSSMLDPIALMLHKTPSARILDVEGQFSADILEHFGELEVTITANSNESLQAKKELFKAWPTLDFMQLDLGGRLEGPRESYYDLVLLGDEANAAGLDEDFFRPFLTGNGLCLCFNPSAQISGPSSDAGSAFSEWTAVTSIGTPKRASSLPRTPPSEACDASMAPQRSLYIIYRSEMSPVGMSLQHAYSQRGYKVAAAALKNASPAVEDQVLILPENDDQFLGDLRFDELQNLQKIATLVPYIVWATFGNSIRITKPKSGLACGLARVLRSENSSLKLITIDFDASSSSRNSMVDMLTLILDNQVDAPHSMEYEYAVCNGTIHIPRIIAIDSVNQNLETTSKDLVDLQLSEKSRLRGVLQSSQIRFQEVHDMQGALALDEVEFRTVAVGLNEEDVLGITGHGYRTTISHEIGGIVTRVGSNVSNIQIGDPVVGFAFDSFSTYQRTPAALLTPVNGSHSVKVMTSLPMAYCSALYALNDLGRVEEDEFVVLLADSSSAAWAAVQVCQLSKANILIVTSSQEAYAHLKCQDLPKNAQTVCASVENVAGVIKDRTAGAGADIVFASKSADADLLARCISTIAPYGRVILNGARHQHADVMDCIPRSTELNISFFDILELCERRPKTISRLLKQCVQLYKDSQPSHHQSTLFYNIDKINEAVHDFSNSVITGKTVITYTDSSSVKALPSRPLLQFDAEAVYLLVGCLGGLGRSLASWMVDRGARHLAFMARSGAANPVAASLVSDLRARNVEVTVLKGDVSSIKDTDHAIYQLTQARRLAGVINAAMVLNDGTFPSLTLDQWHRTLAPKVTGSLNLWESIARQDDRLGSTLDFFLLTSSVSGTIGTPGQANYSAANTFLDVFATYLRNLPHNPLPATSLVLPMVLGTGVVAENAGLEDALSRKGIYGVEEDELLRGFEVAMSAGTQKLPTGIIMGLEPSKLARSIYAEETTDTTWLHDPRFSTVRSEVERLRRIATGSASPSSGGAGGAGSALAGVKAAASLEDAVPLATAALRSRLARLLGLDEADISTEEDGARSVGSYGLDSMIGTEFRNWLFKEFAVNVPFQKLQMVTVWALGREIVVAARDAQ